MAKTLEKLCEMSVDKEGLPSVGFAVLGEELIINFTGVGGTRGSEDCECDETFGVHSFDSLDSHIQNEFLIDVRPRVLHA